MKKIPVLFMLILFISLSAFAETSTYTFTFNSETAGEGKMLDLSDHGLSFFLPDGFEEKTVVNNDNAICYYQRNDPWHSVEFLRCAYATLDDAKGEYASTTPIQATVNGMDSIIFVFKSTDKEGKSLFVCDAFIAVPDHGIMNYYEESDNQDDLALYLLNVLPSKNEDNAKKSDDNSKGEDTVQQKDSADSKTSSDSEKTSADSKVSSSDADKSAADSEDSSSDADKSAADSKDSSSDTDKSAADSEDSSSDADKSAADSKDSSSDSEKSSDDSDSSKTEVVFTEERSVRTQDVYINVRKGPNADSERLCAAAPNSVYPLVSIAENGWYEIRLRDGRTGFISPKMARLIK